MQIMALIGELVEVRLEGRVLFVLGHAIKINVKRAKKRGLTLSLEGKYVSIPARGFN